MPFVTSTLLAAAATASALQVPAVAVPVATPLRATLQTCKTGAAPAERFAVFAGSMPAREGAARMAMRFELQARDGADEAFRRVRVPALDRWQRSGTGKGGFIYAKRVDALRAPAAYRAVVRFRWSAADGEVLSTARRVTKACTQPDPRPNLRLLAVEIEDGASAASERYALTIANAGRGPAGAFEVDVSVGERRAKVTVGGLAAGEGRRIEIAGPPCVPGGELHVRLDTLAAVAESDERDNDIRRDCG